VLAARRHPHHVDDDARDLHRGLSWWLAGRVRFGGAGRQSSGMTAQPRRR
jgi:hypothetical protein